MHSDDTESGSSVSSKEVVQPSPVSVLEPPSEEKSSLGCFKRVSADGKGKREKNIISHSFH